MRAVSLCHNVIIKFEAFFGQLTKLSLILVTDDDDDTKIFRISCDDSQPNESQFKIKCDSALQAMQKQQAAGTRLGGI